MPLEAKLLLTGVLAVVVGVLAVIPVVMLDDCGLHRTAEAFGAIACVLLCVGAALVVVDALILIWR